MNDGLVIRIFIGATLTFAGLSTFSGCSKKSEGPSAAASASVTAATPAEPGATAAVAASAPASSSSIPLPAAAVAFGGRFEAEAAHRPTGTPRAEDMFAAIEKKGIPLHNVQQFMGAPVGAKFCAGADTDKKVFLSVCEYADPKAATEGKAMSEKVFAAIARKLYVNKASLLTIRDDGKTPETAEQQKVIAETFAGL
jgi:hypothetical protein